jgi:hypothetical protein
VLIQDNAGKLRAFTKKNWLSRIIPVIKLAPMVADLSD